MKSKIALFGILLITLAACTSKPLTTIPTNQPAPTPWATTQKSELKTFSKRYFSLQYPSSWIIESYPNFSKSENQAETIRIFNPATMREVCGNGGCSGLQKPSEYIYITTSNARSTPAQIIANIDAEFKKDTANPTIYEAFKKSRKQLTINGETAEAYHDQYEGSVEGYLLILSKSKIQYDINISDETLDTETPVRKILNSFKITN